MCWGKIQPKSVTALAVMTPVNSVTFLLGRKALGSAPKFVNLLSERLVLGTCGSMSFFYRFSGCNYSLVVVAGDTTGE